MWLVRLPGNEIPILHTLELHAPASGSGFRREPRLHRPLADSPNWLQNKEASPPKPVGLKSEHRTSCGPIVLHTAMYLLTVLEAIKIKREGTICSSGWA